ncbi:hypothetical protein [Vannielia sp.]|uniref:hypothetical protein n=1 Tax=Vannielia sp. TaxID=2813045 RepID=UPI00260FCC44|nr:hypothetical protein [Vannielia sp.]MDF1871328.1 hypothetical protein [Vannielia sp.]
MKRILAGALIAVCALGVAGEAAAKNKVTRQIKVDDSFQREEIKGEEAKGYVIRYKIIAVDGVVELCGAGYSRNAMFKRTAKSVLRGLSLEMNGKKIIRNFTFFNDVRGELSSLDGQLANCASSGKRAVKGARFGFDARMVYY